jgi:PAS domain S-box-containing protein
MPSEHGRGLRLVVADGDPAFADSVAAACEEVEEVDSAEAVTTAGAAVESAGSADSPVDGVLVGDGLDDPVDLVERLDGATASDGGADEGRVDARGSPPAVVLSDDGTVVAAAVAAGAVDCLPRTTAAEQYELVVETVASEHRGSGGARDRWDDRAVFENVSDGLVMHDPGTGEILDVNERFCEMNGYEREELVGDTLDEVTATEEGFDYEAATERIERAADGDPQLFEWRGSRKDGETYPVEVHLAVVDIDGDERVLASVRDVTERKRREREFEQIFDGVNDAIVVFDPDAGEILDVNRAYHDLLGYDSLERIRELGIEGLSATEAGYTGEDGWRLIQEVATTGDPTTVEWQAERKDGEVRWLEVTLAPADIGGEQRVLSIQRDVTSKKRRERIVRTLHDATDRLQEAETPEAVCEATVEAAEAVLDLPMPSCWLPDDDGTLTPVAASEAAWKMPGGPGEFDPGSFEYGIYEGDELVTYDPRERWDQTPFREAFLVPLGDHGLLGAAEPDVESYDDVTLDAARILASHATSALDRVERARELRESEHRFRTMAERVDEVIYMASPDMTEVEYVSEGYEDVWGEPVSRLEEDPFSFIEGIHPDDRDEYRRQMERMRSDVAADDPDERYEFAYRVQRPDGEVRWVDATGYPLRDDGGEVHRIVGIIRDVTERKRREQTLETFHEATRQLTAVDSRQAACEEAVRGAEDVLGFPLVSAHLYDEETGRLEPVATTDRLAGLDVEPPAFGPGDSLAWQVYVDGESTTATGQASDVYGPGISGPDIVLPLGQHGVMLVGAPVDAFDSEDVELAQILAATLEASLNHVADERALAEQEAELERERERARRLQRLNDIIRDIEQATVERSARAGIETAVCERLAAVDLHELVWIAEETVGGDELVPRTSDGDVDAYLDALSLDADAGAESHPAVAAVRDSERRTVSNVATEVPAGEWRTTALQHGVQSVLAVPIRHGSTVHGVLAVESREPDAFDDAIGEVLAELGRSIGYAITMSEREQALESEGATELEFAVDDEGLFMVRGAAETGGTVRLERTIRRTGGSFSTVYVVDGADPERLVERATATASVEEATVVTADEDGEAGLVDVRAPTWFGSVFTDHGAIVQEASADPDGGRLVVETPQGADVRELVEGFQERYPGAELVAQRQRERTVRSLFGLQDALQEGLTDRQWEALETAYSAGYFAWPRETSGEEVAELLGVTQPTFNKHLRTAERTAFRMLLDREYPDAGD